MSQEKTFTIVKAYHSDGCPTKFEGKSVEISRTGAELL